jgi:serine/threonine-protein kinase
VKGKFAFMAPEQVRGQLVDCRTDLFALGILLYSITTGKHPFRGAHPGETLQNICSELAPTPPSALSADYPEALEAVVMKALAKAPEQRFASGNELLLALEDAMPHALESRFERQVAAYLHGLFGEHASERRAAIRLAQVQVDRQRADTSSSSVGTLRAISIERQDSGDFALSHPALPIEALEQGPKHVPVSEARSRRLMAVGVALGISVLGLAFQLRHGSPHVPSSAAAGRGLPETSLPVATVAPATQPAVAPAAPHSAPDIKTLPELADKRQRKTTRTLHAPSMPLKAQLAPPSTASEPAPATTPPSSAAPAPAVASSNAWNRGAFGGRH